MCQNDENYICAKVEENFQCIRKRAIDHNPILEYVFINPVTNKLNYICRYPKFISNNGNVEERCQYFHACSPKGELIDKANGKVITNANDIKKTLENYSCNCDINHAPYFLEYPRCKLANVQDLLNNFDTYKDVPCIGFEIDYDREICKCPPGYVSNKDETALKNFGYKATLAYDLTLLPKTCVKKPCLFDPATNAYHETNAYWDSKMRSCRCNISSGLIGVYVNEAGNGNAVDVASAESGYNACITVHERERISYYGYMRQYVAPKGIPELFYYSEEYDKSKFPTLEATVTKFREEHNNNRRIHPYFKPTYNQSLNKLALSFKYEYPLDLTTHVNSIDERRTITYNKEDSLFIKLDGTYDHPFYKDGDYVRNPTTYDVNNAGTVINPYLTVEDDIVAILAYNVDNIKNTDLIALPQKKK